MEAAIILDGDDEPIREGLKWLSAILVLAIDAGWLWSDMVTRFIDTPDLEILY